MSTLKRIIAALVLVCLFQSASAQISVRTALSDDREVQPGTTYEGVIQVWNETEQIQQAKIYQTDYLFYADGSNVYGEPGRDERSNANWVRVTATTHTIPPLGKILVNYIVEVPEFMNGQSVTGSYWSMIMVEGVPRESSEATFDPVTGKPQYSLLQVTRYGIQIATHIVGSGESELAMSGGQFVELDDGEISLVVKLENTGSRMLNTEIWVELYDDEGAAFGRRNGVRSRIYPATSIRQKIRLGALGPGAYRALVIADAGENDVFGAEYRLQVE